MRFLLCGAVTCLMACTPSASAKTAEAIDCGALPQAVRKASAAYTASSTRPPACERITEGKTVLFEVKVFSPAGRMQEWVYRPDGSLEESEEEIPASETPAAALEAIHKAVGKGQLRKIDKLRRGKQVFYEGEYTVNGEKRKVIFDAAGRLASS